MRSIKIAFCILLLALSAAAADLEKATPTQTPPDSIEVIPAGDTAVSAGEQIAFQAIGYDSAGNVLPALSFAWSLASPLDSIGFFAGSTFTAVEVGLGRVKAVAEGVTGQSGVITVKHGDLDRMFLDLDQTQFVGLPLITSGEVILYDAWDNLVIDYDLEQKPINLETSAGELQPNVIDDNAFQIGGVVRLLPAQIRFGDATAISEVYAASDGVNSQVVAVSFNGYDILDILGTDDATLDTIFLAGDSTVKVVVQNNGSLAPGAPVRVLTSFETGGTTTQQTFTGQSLSIVDTVVVPVPQQGQPASLDELVVRLEADFLIGEQTYTTIDSARLPVTVIQPVFFSVVENSVLPDSAYPGEPFLLSFDVLAEAFDGDVDSTLVSLHLSEDAGGPTVAVVYDGAPAYASYIDDVIGYDGLTGLVPAEAGLASGWYLFRFDYTLYSGGLHYTLEDAYPDSVFLLAAVDLAYVAQSLQPAVVFAGDDAQFGFELMLANDFPIKLYSALSAVSVSGSGFSASASLAAPQDALNPGSNSILSEGLFIPQSQLGQVLRLAGTISYSVLSDQPTFVFATDFDQQEIAVEQLPVLQILRVDAIAPNEPRVNTGQAFSILCRMTNLGSTAVGPLVLSLTSDGASLFEPEQTLASIAANDTVNVSFDVVASDQVSTAEVFRVEILSDGFTHAPHKDNTALVQIERPAELVIDYRLLGLEKSVIPWGREFGLVVEIDNIGDAETTDGTYLLTTGGVDFDGGDSLTGDFTVGEHVNFTFTAPSFDTSVTFTFTVVDVPLDKNSQSQAIVPQRTLEFPVTVESLEADLQIEPDLPGEKLILPGRSKELFALNLMNFGLSPNTRIGLQELSLRFFDLDGEPLPAADVIVVGATGFVENGAKVSVAAAGEDRVDFTFRDFIIEPNQCRRIVLRAEIKPLAARSLKVQLDREDIRAAFVQGPNAGLSPSVVSSVEGPYLVDADFALKRQDLRSSLVVKNNPFNPETESAVFSYELTEPSRIEFRIFTLTGEEVYSRDFLEGSDYGRVGEHFVEWDGCNDKGVPVLNGVYVALLKVNKTGETARVKIALVK